MKRRSIALNSYAKVNYTLDVLSRRTDGFHNLASVMQTISLADRIVIEERDDPDVTIECDDDAIPSDETNLAWRAAHLFLQEAGVTRGVHIRLNKRTPSQAGLGGGSSNAAAVLRALNLLLNLNVDSTILRKLAGSLGSDVPFFLTGGAAAIRGRGEQVFPLADGPPFHFVIVKPETGVSTANAYAEMDALPNRVSARATKSMEEAINQRDAALTAMRMSNDFEQVVLEKHPLVAAVYDDLLMARARVARLCGSGSAVFGLTASRAEAEETARLMHLKYKQVIICRALPRSESLAMDAVEETVI